MQCFVSAAKSTLESSEVSHVPRWSRPAGIYGTLDFCRANVPVTARWLVDSGNGLRFSMRTPLITNASRLNNMPRANGPCCVTLMYVLYGHRGQPSMLSSLSSDSVFRRLFMYARARIYFCLFLPMDRRVLLRMPPAGTIQYDLRHGPPCRFTPRMARIRDMAVLPASSMEH